MRIELRRSLLVALAIWASACDSQADIASKSAPTKVEVKSSLEGMTTLPDRLHWSVTSSLPLEEVREVRFTIDGKKFWTDSEPPFSYGEDGGYFVTTWLASGEHRFRANVFDDEGRKWSKTVQASVRESHVSAPVMGVWWRLTQAELRNPSPPGKSPQIDGWLWLTYGSVWLHAFEEKQRFSDEPGFAYEASMDANELRVSTPIFMGSEQTAGGLRGWFVQNYQCAPDGPPATYSWSARRGRVLGKVKGKPTYARYIVLRARDEPCAARQQLMEGTWENLGP